jgi:hypothetical protein
MKRNTFKTAMFYCFTLPYDISHTGTVCGKQEIARVQVFRYEVPRKMLYLVVCKGITQQVTPKVIKITHYCWGTQTKEAMMRWTCSFEGEERETRTERELKVKGKVVPVLT